MQPGEERRVAMLRGFSSASLVRVGTATAWEKVTTNKEETLSYELKAVLFDDGTFYGPDDVFQDFSGQVDTVRSQARDVQYSENKYEILAQHKAAFSNPETILKAMRTASVDSRGLGLRSSMAALLLGIKDNRGEQEAEAALARIASLPDVTKGE